MVENMSINRTFMELKLRIDLTESITISVLIEPLWNWNYIAVMADTINISINRTFMELKPDTKSFLNVGIHKY